MPMYAYKGVSSVGKAAKGLRNADSPKALRSALRSEGVTVTEFHISKGGKKQSKGGGLGKEVHFEFLSGISRADIMAFTRQMATLLRAGMPLTESLGAMFETTEKASLQSIIGEVRTAVNEGTSFADALEKHPKQFDNLYISMVRAGEQAGNLDEVLTRLADFLESSQKLIGKVKSAMTYPIIMMVVGAIIMVVLMVKVIPNITSMFAQSKKELPWNTEFLIWTSKVIGNYWVLLFLLAAGGFAAWWYWKQTPNGRKTWDGLLLRAPMVGELLRRVAVSRFCQTLGTMLKSGVPMLQAMETSKQIVGNEVLKEAVEKARDAVAEGESLAKALEDTGQFPIAALRMISVGERSGTLEEMLLRVSESYAADIEMRLERFVSMLEPLILVTMGVTVGFIIFAVLGPMLDLSSLRR